MDVYDRLPIEMKEVVDKHIFDIHVKPIYEKVMEEVLMNPYRCEFCDKYAVLFDMEMNIIDLGNICLNCQNEMEYNYSDSSYDIEEGSTTSGEIESVDIDFIDGK